MRIIEINIVEFAGVKNKKISFSQGFNLVVGDNETGKSTICAFIKFIFYGLSNVSERDRYLSIDSKQCKGAIAVQTEDGEYVIERLQGDSPKSVIKIRKVGGEEIKNWNNNASSPGEYFMGIGEELYLRSVYVNQENRSKLDNATSDAITNLLVSGSENISVASAKKNLDALRQKLLHKNKRGGEIFRLQTECQTLVNNLSNAASEKSRLRGLSNQISDTEQELQLLQQKYQNQKSDIAKVKNAKINKLLYEKSELNRKKQIDEPTKKLIFTKYSRADFIADEEYISELSVANSDYSVKKRILNDTEKESNILEFQISDQQRSEIKIIEENGGVDRLKKLGEKAENLTKTTKKAATAWVIFAAVMVILTAVMFSKQQFFIGICLGATLVLLSLITALTIRNVKKSTLGFQRICESLCVTPTRTFDTILDDYTEYQTRKLIAEDTRSINAKNLEEKRSQMLQSEEKYKNLLSKWGRESYEQAVSDYNAYKKELSAADEASREVKNKLEVVEGKLAMYSEVEIKAAVDSQIRDDRLAEMDDYTIKKQLENLENEVNSTSTKLQILRLSDAKTSAALPNMLEISAKIEDIKRELHEKNELFEAVIMATNALENSELSIKTLVTPYLCERSSQIFETITEGRYTHLKVDDSFALKYRHQDDPQLIESRYFSIGSSDLAWLSLRLALHEKLCNERSLPMILDECLVYFDDTRLRKTLEFLKSNNGKSTQVILFSASRRELEMLGLKDNVIRL